MIINQIANPFGKLFYLATNLNKEGRINDEEKGRLKGVFPHPFILNFDFFFL